MPKPTANAAVLEHTGPHRISPSKVNTHSVRSVGGPKRTAGAPMKAGLISMLLPLAIGMSPDAGAELAQHGIPMVWALVAGAVGPVATVAAHKAGRAVWKGAAAGFRGYANGQPFVRSFLHGVADQMDKDLGRDTQE